MRIDIGGDSPCVLLGPLFSDGPKSVQLVDQKQCLLSCVGTMKTISIRPVYTGSDRNRTQLFKKYVLITLCRLVPLLKTMECVNYLVRSQNWLDSDGIPFKPCHGICTIRTCRGGTGTLPPK